MREKDLLKYYITTTVLVSELLNLSKKLGWSEICDGLKESSFCTLCD